MKQLRSDRIYIDLWLSMKPYQTPVGTDHYYLRLANELKLRLEKSGHAAYLLKYLDPDYFKFYCCFIVAYFEDIISETNIWTTFVNCYQKQTNEEVPFYEAEYYEKDDINWQDIAFLTWYFISISSPDNIVYPKNKPFYDIAAVVSEFFEDAYEYAPENKHLESFYHLDEDETDYYIFREFLYKLMLGSYLFCPEYSFRLHDDLGEFIANNNEEALSYIAELKDNHIWSKCTRLLAMRPAEWAAEYLGEGHRLSEAIRSIPKRVSGSFFYKGQDEKHIILEHINSGLEFKLLSSSYDYRTELKASNTILTLGMVQWQDEWWFSGVSANSPYDKAFVEKERKSMPAKMQISFIDRDYTQAWSFLQEQYEAFLKYNDGEPIAFMLAGDVNKFYTDYLNFYNAMQQEKKNGKSSNSSKASKLPNVNLAFSDPEEKTSPALFFFNPKSGGELNWGINSAFPLKHNPWYNAKESQQAVVHLLLSDGVSVEMVHYCLQHCKEKLPLFNTEIGKWILKDLDFLLRFWKREQYHTVPRTILVKSGDQVS